VRWGDNIKIVRDLEYEDVKWIELSRDNIKN
jgi:hypothetical protein